MIYDPVNNEINLAADHGSLITDHEDQWHEG